MLRSQEINDPQVYGGTLKPGLFMHWRSKNSQILEITSDRAIRGLYTDPPHTEDVIPLDDILLDPDGKQPILAKTLNNLKFLLNKEYTPTDPMPEASIPEHLLAKADLVIRVVEEVEERLKYSAAICTRNGTKQLRGEALKVILDKMNVPSSTCYKYLKIYQKHNGNRASIALSFRRSSFNKITKDKVSTCLADILIARYYARQDMHIAPSHVYEKILLPLAEKDA